MRKEKNTNFKVRNIWKEESWCKGCSRIRERKTLNPDPWSRKTHALGCLATMWSVTRDTLQYIWYNIEQLDIEYWKWVLWVIYPVVISFFLPLILLLFVHSCALFLHVYRYRHRLRAAYGHDFWDGAKKTIAAFWYGQSKIWHGEYYKPCFFVFFFFLMHVILF